VSLKANRAICQISQIALSYIRMAVRTSASNLTGEPPLTRPGSYEARGSGAIVYRWQAADHPAFIGYGLC
jgi:hypothetical protein